MSQPVPSPSPEVEAQRRRTLRTYKAYVTGLLAVAAAIFLACTWWQSHEAAQGVEAAVWVGYVRAAAEAGMVGGLADWFAVTALFRHPLGLPIPHTALIPRKKDQVGEALSEFVGENFLNPQLITEKVASAGVPERAGAWLEQPKNAETVSRQAGTFIARVVRAIDPVDAEALINTHIIGRFADPVWAPYAGRLLDTLIADGKTEPVVDALITWARRRVYQAEEPIISMIDERMPQWAPRFAKNLVGERIYREVVAFVEDVDDNPDHEARQSIRRFLNQLATDLQEDPVMIGRVEAIKQDIMSSRAMQEAGATAWSGLSQALLDAAEDEGSMLRRKIVEACTQWGHRVQVDETLRTKLDERVTSTVRFFTENYSGEVTSIISETIERWDAEEASRKIELMVGKDLQFIRLNGTVVGALAGLLIYAVARVLFG